MKCLSVVVVFCTGLCASSCLPIKKLQRQQESRLLRDQIQQTSQVLTQLDRTPDPERANQFSVFVPVTMLNEIFSKADDLYFDPSDPNLKNVRILLKKFRANFDAGLAYLDFTASACTRPTNPANVCGDISITLRTTAFVHIESQAVPTVPGQATVSVEIMDVVPDVKIGIFDFKLRGFVRELIKVELARLVSEKVPKMFIPLETGTHIAYQGTPIETNIPTPRDNSAILGNLITPSLGKDLSLQVNTALFLKDGAHIYMQVK